MKSQKAQILDYMVKKGPISPYAAASEFKVDRLSARIFELRKDGIPIVARRKKSFSGKRYNEYFIDGAEYGASNFRG